jgi:uncharacterized protein DUF6988
MHLDTNKLLVRSADLEARLNQFLVLKPLDESERLTASRIICSVYLEHAESAKILIASGNFTSATGLVRLQYEALVRGMWLLYAASDTAVSNLLKELSYENAPKNEKLPMLSQMLIKLEGKAPVEAMEPLQEFKEYSWKPLNSFVHGGVHAVHRHSKGCPLDLLELVLKASNAVSLMVGMLLVILSCDQRQLGKIPKIQMEFRDCLPPLK